MVPFDLGYLGYLLFSLGCGIAAAAFGHSLIDDNVEATDVIVTVFSILAGFLIAVMSLLGDQSILPGSWRIAEKQRNSIRAKLNRHKALFLIYLVTLLQIFVATLIRPHWPEVTDWLERVYFGFATAAFMLSLSLPSTLMDIQMDRTNAVIETRRGKSSKIDKS